MSWGVVDCMTIGTNLVGTEQAVGQSIAKVQRLPKNKHVFLTSVLAGDCGSTRCNFDIIQCFIFWSVWVYVDGRPCVLQNNHVATCDASIRMAVQLVVAICSPGLSHAIYRAAPALRFRMSFCSFLVEGDLLVRSSSELITCVLVRRRLLILFLLIFPCSDC